MSRSFVLALIFAIVAVCTAAPAATRQLSEVSSGWDDIEWTPATGIDYIDTILDGLETGAKGIFVQVTELITAVAKGVDDIFDMLATTLLDVVTAAGVRLAPLASILAILEEFANSSNK
eukprot:scaffold18776_cov140-Isochrysis_galbana.AAC.3